MPLSRRNPPRLTAAQRARKRLRRWYRRHPEQRPRPVVTDMIASVKAALGLG